MSHPGQYAEACTTGALPKLWTPPQPSSTYPPPATTATCPAGEPGVAPKMTRSPNCGATAPPLGSCCHGVLSLGPTSHIWYAYATGQIGGAPKRSDAQRCASSTHSYRRP